jgi:hypothetical protein
MTNMLFLTLTKTYSFVKLLSAATVGLVSFAIASEWTHSLGLAVVCQSFATIGAAYLMNRHKFAGVKNQHELGLMDRLHSEHAEVMKFMTDRLRQQNQLIAVLTIVKHAFANECEALNDHMQLRGELLEDNKLSFPKFSGRDFSTLVKKEDELRAQIADLDPATINAIIH